MGQQFRHLGRPGLPILGELTGGQKDAGGAVAQQVVVIDGLAAQFRHGHRVRLGRCRLAVAQQLAGVLAGRAAEILAEAAGLELHFGPATVAFEHRPLVALDAELAALQLEAGAVRVVAADVQLALCVDQEAVHRRTAQRASALAAQQLGFALVVRRGGLIGGRQVERFLAAFLGRQPVAGAAEEHAGAGGSDLHRPAAFRAIDVRVRGQVGPHAAVALPSAGQVLAEVLVEGVQHRAPAGLAGGDLVKLPLQFGGEPVVQQVLELLHQAVVDQFAYLLRMEAALGQADVAALLNGGDDGGVGGGAADAALLQLPH